MKNLENFDPEFTGNPENNIFGLPFCEEDARLIVLPVPWEVTASYGDGTARAYERVFKASMQVDLYDDDFPNAWRRGIFMPEANVDILNKSDYLRNEAELYMDYVCKGEKLEDNEFIKDNLLEVNEGSVFLNNWLYDKSKKLLLKNKLIGILGGDHSTPFGFIKALAEGHDQFGILHIDAHCDLRNSYLGFKYSHASIMFNVLKEIPEVTQLVQVGVRDFSQSEKHTTMTSPDRVTSFFHRDVRRRMYEGDTWKVITDDIISCLPEKIYISFDIDGLLHSLCPQTGTPVMGGLTSEELFYLFSKLVKDNKKIIGFDLVEIGIGENDWDANVGARILWKLANLTIGTNDLMGEESDEFTF